MSRVLPLLLFLILSCAPASARPDNAKPPETPQDAAPIAKIDGGPRPAIRAKAPPVVSFPSRYSKGTIVIDTKRRRLLYVLSRRRAYLYPISVGRLGFQWTGTHKVTAKRKWPSWHPPAEMRERNPKLPIKMTGGVNNPLGARALYLGSTLYRIHGTNNTRSIGRAASSGCFRMHNSHVAHLSQITRLGARVVVVNALPSRMARSFSRKSRRLAKRTRNRRAKRRGRITVRQVRRGRTVRRIARSSNRRVTRASNRRRVTKRRVTRTSVRRPTATVRRISRVRRPAPRIRRMAWRRSILGTN